MEKMGWDLGGKEPSVKCGICHNVFTEHQNIETVHKTLAIYKFVAKNEGIQ